MNASANNDSALVESFTSLTGLLNDLAETVAVLTKQVSKNSQDILTLVEVSKEDEFDFRALKETWNEVWTEKITEEVSQREIDRFFHVFEETCRPDRIYMAYSINLIETKLGGKLASWLEDLPWCLNGWDGYPDFKEAFLRVYQERRPIHSHHATRFCKLRQQGLVDELAREFEGLMRFLPKEFENPVIQFAAFRSALSPQLYAASTYVEADTWKDLHQWARGMEAEMSSRRKTGCTRKLRRMGRQATEA